MPLTPDRIQTLELARVTGIDKAHISRIFSRKSKPGIELAVQLAHHLDVTVDELCQYLGIGTKEDLTLTDSSRS